MIWISGSPVQKVSYCRRERPNAASRHNAPRPSLDSSPEYSASVHNMRSAEAPKKTCAFSLQISVRGREPSTNCTCATSERWYVASVSVSATAPLRHEGKLSVQGPASSRVRAASPTFQAGGRGTERSLENPSDDAPNESDRAAAETTRLGLQPRSLPSS